VSFSVEHDSFFNIIKAHYQQHSSPRIIPSISSQRSVPPFGQLVQFLDDETEVLGHMWLSLFVIDDSDQEDVLFFGTF